MRKISDLVNRQLKWVQPSALKMDYELRSADELAASLHFRSSFGSFATAESADGCWTFKRVGFWQTSVTVRPCGANDDIAFFRNNTWSGGGTLEFPGGRRILANTKCWKMGYEILYDALATDYGQGIGLNPRNSTLSREFLMIFCVT